MTGDDSVIEADRSLSEDEGATAFNGSASSVVVAPDNVPLSELSARTTGCPPCSFEIFAMAAPAATVEVPTSNPAKSFISISFILKKYGLATVMLLIRAPRQKGSNPVQPSSSFLRSSNSLVPISPFA